MSGQPHIKLRLAALRKHRLRTNEIQQKRNTIWCTRASFVIRISVRVSGGERRILKIEQVYRTRRVENVKSSVVVLTSLT